MPADKCGEAIAGLWSRSATLLVQCYARQRRIMPPSLGKQKSIAQAEPHETNPSMIDRKACGWRACPRAEKKERSVCSYFRICALSDLLRTLLLRRLLMERRTMFAQSGTAESDLLRKWSALRASAINLRIVP